MSENPIVSVKMITYNHELYIAQAIEGVLKQETGYPFELIIGEDRSTDRTLDIVLEYQSKFPDIIRVITADENVGAKKNSYRTGKACRGKYIAYCEGDDYWHHPHKLQKQVEYMESHPACGMIFSDCDVYHTESNKYKRSFNYNNGYQSAVDLTFEQILWGDIAKWTCTAMARRDLYEKIIEEDPYLHQSEQFLMGDLQLWAEMTLISKVSYIPDCFSTYRVLDESASRSKNSTKSLRFWKSASEIKLYLCDKHNLPDNHRRREELAWCYHSLRLSFYERNADLALEVKNKKPLFTFKEWLLYFGARCLPVYYICHAAIFFIKILKKEKNVWP